MPHRHRVVPFNQEGEAVKRGIVSVPATAARDKLLERVLYCAQRTGMGRIVHVEIQRQDGSLHAAWDVRRDSIVQTDGPGSEVYAEAVTYADTGPWPTIEQSSEGVTTMNDKTATAAAPAADKPKAAKAPAAPKGPSKKDQVLAMLKGGAVSLEAIEKKLGVTQAAARALIGDVQRMEGMKIEREKKDGTSFYKLGK